MKQYFSSKKITPLYVKQFPLVDFLCTDKVFKILIKTGSLQLKNPSIHDLNTQDNLGFSN